MRALAFRDHLEFSQNYPPPQPSFGEALIRVSMAGICNTDLEITKGYMGFSGVLGHEFVGTVEQINAPDCSLVGKRVVGEINCPPVDWSGPSSHAPGRCVLGISGRNGAFADYCTLPVRNLHPVSDLIPSRRAVFVEPLAAALRILDDIHIKPSHRIVVLGDGKLGQLCARVLRRAGCDIILAGKYPEKLALSVSLGINTCLSDEIEEIADYDVVVEATGSVSGFKQALRLLRPQGTLILKSTLADTASLNLALVVVNEIRVIGNRCGPFAPALRLLTEPDMHLEQLITSEYPLEDGVVAMQTAASNESLKVLLHMEE
jgi:threonine dehydrogenase-like Zn-dependent dehydrogenase